jgi:hypothetical protein
MGRTTKGEKMKFDKSAIETYCLIGLSADLAKNFFYGNVKPIDIFDANITDEQKLWLLLHSTALTESQKYNLACGWATNAIHYWHLKYKSNEALDAAIDARMLWLNGSVSDAHLNTIWEDAIKAVEDANTACIDSQCVGAIWAAWAALDVASTGITSSACAWSVSWDARTASDRVEGYGFGEVKLTQQLQDVRALIGC